MLPNCRSLLFVPADNSTRLQKALALGADAVILDLEDGVTSAAKAQARQNIALAAQQLHDGGIGVVVRINAGWRDVMADLAAAIDPSMQAIMVPKVEDAGRLLIIAEMIDEFALDKGMAPGSIKLIALIESPAGLAQLQSIARVETLAGLALGTEDFSLALGVAPLPDMLDYPAREIALAASTRGLMALAVPISIAEFRDIDAYNAAATRAAGFGVTGAICIHPAQVNAANQCFQPSTEAINKAQAIVAAWDQAQAEGKAVTALNGMMIDLPVAERAKRLLQELE
jgi:citrate lyase subunit beta / citryl-CoA lyase